MICGKIKDIKGQSMEQKRIIAVAGIIEGADGKILCTQRDKSKNDEVSFKWEFPGGKMEYGETAKQTIARELKEELDIVVKVEDLFYTVEFDYPNFHLSMPVYKCKMLSKNYKLNVHKSAMWLEKSKILSLDWAPADLLIAKQIQKQG